MDDRLKLTILGFGLQWKGWTWRQQMYYDYLKTTEWSHIAIVDTDIFLNEHVSSSLLLEKYRKLVPNEDKALVSVEKLCCTMDMSMDKEKEMIDEMYERRRELQKFLTEISAPTEISDKILSIFKIFINFQKLH